MPGASPLEGETAEPVSDLSTVIQESQNVMNEVPQVTVRNKGGRPKGSKTKKHSEPEPAPQPVAMPEPRVSLAPMLGKIAALPYSIAASRTRFDGYRLTEEEELAIGGSLDEVILKYFPNLSEKAGVGVMCCFTILAVTLAKTQAHEAWKAEIKLKVMEAHAVQNADLRPAETVPEMNLGGNPFVSKV